eukprot:7964525-Heterocapsa_arctica.AAC.1
MIQLSGNIFRKSALMHVMSGDGVNSLKSAVFGTQENMFGLTIPIPLTPQTIREVAFPKLLEQVKRDGPDDSGKCCDKMTKHPFPIQGGSGAKNYCEEEWDKLDPLVLGQAGKAPINRSGGFLNQFLNSIIQTTSRGKQINDEDDEDSQNETRVPRGTQSQDEDRNVRRIARKKKQGEKEVRERKSKSNGPDFQGRVKKWGGLVAGNRTDRPTLSPKRSNEEELPRRTLARTEPTERSKTNTPKISKDDGNTIEPQLTRRNFPIFEYRNSLPAASSYADGKGEEDRTEQISQQDQALGCQNTPDDTR